MGQGCSFLEPGCADARDDGDGPDDDRDALPDPRAGGHKGETRHEDRAGHLLKTSRKWRFPEAFPGLPTRKGGHSGRF